MNDLNSHNSGWQLLRSVTAVDNPALAASTMDSKPPFAVSIAAGQIRGLEFIVAAIGDDNGVVGVKLWAGKGQGGPARCIAAITFTLGTMLVSKDPQTQGVTDLTRYADTAAVTSYWPTEIKNPNSGNNMLCTVSLDGLDADWLAAEVVTLTNATKAHVYFGYFN